MIGLTDSIIIGLLISIIIMLIIPNLSSDALEGLMILFSLLLIGLGMLLFMEWTGMGEIFRIVQTSPELLTEQMVLDKMIPFMIKSISVFGGISLLMHYWNKKRERVYNLEEGS